MWSIMLVFLESGGLGIAGGSIASIILALTTPNLSPDLCMEDATILAVARCDLKAFPQKPSCLQNWLLLLSQYLCI